MSILSPAPGAVQQHFPTFAAIPTSIVDDPRLAALDIRLLGVLLGYARGKGVAWPANSTLAKRLGVSVRTVARSLARLIQAGWLASVRILPRPGNMTGRVLRLLFGIAPRAEAQPETSVQDRPSLSDPLRPSCHTKEDSGNENGTATEPVSTPDLIAQLPGRPDLAGAAAARIASDCQDPASLGYYRRLCRSVASGGAPVARLLDAYRASRDSRARKPGALLAQFWGLWRARPTSGGVSADPAAYIAARTAQRAEERTRDEAAAEECRSAWEQAAADPSNPLHRFAAKLRGKGGQTAPPATLRTA